MGKLRDPRRHLKGNGLFARDDLRKIWLCYPEPASKVDLVDAISFQVLFHDEVHGLDITKK